MSQLDDRGPFTKPRREPKEPTPTRPPVNRPAPVPPAPPRPPQPAPAPLPEPFDDGTRGPIVKPRPEPKEPKAPSSIIGPIGDRWRQLGGASWATPAFAPQNTGDGRGRFADFVHPNGSNPTIIWTEKTGARLILGEMRNAWNRLGRHRGVLGYPTSDEMLTHDRVGRFQTFEGGLIVWHPSTGAREVHGAILARYSQLGGSMFGYPITDESVAGSDRRGRFNHFRELTSGAEKSIYWSPETGAQEVYGLIRARWKALGWETSYLGYPTSGEVAWSGAPGGRKNSFAGGNIFYSPRHGAFPDPMQWIHYIREGGFKGQVEVTAYSSGRVDLGGYVRSSAAVGYEYLVQSMLQASNNMAVPFTHSGTVTSTHGSDEKDEIRGRVDSPVVAQNYAAFATGKLVVEQNHRNRFTSSLGSLVEGLITWTAGSLLLTPGTAALLVVGTEIVSLATSGSLIPGARIISGTMWLAGPYGTLFAMAADGLTRLASNERTLRPAEYDHANLVFKGSLPPREKIMVSDSIGGGKRPFTYPRFDGKIILNMGDYFAEDLHRLTTEDEPKPGQLMIHELAHAWQYHNNAASISYVGDAIWARVREDYDEGEVLSESWDSFGLEEQASIVEHWYQRNFWPTSSAQTEFGLASSTALGDQAFRFIRNNIRTGRN